MSSWNLTDFTQLPTTVNLTDMWRFGFQNTRVCLLEQVNESKVRYSRQSETTCYIMTIQCPGKISLSLVESRTTTYWKQKKAFLLNEATPHQIGINTYRSCFHFSHPSRIVFVLILGLWSLFHNCFIMV